MPNNPIGDTRNITLNLKNIHFLYSNRTAKTLADSIKGS